ncbi:DUF4328 domain-containing protein [Nocardia sp. NPDC050412]|uniref:DUF4328 domain-containing protein n=1 Tax=Nocardia sp. NPDC050412 TaxID=3364320 RepID=UPI0037AE8EEE
MSVQRQVAIARDGGRIRPLGPFGAAAITLIAGAVVMLFVSAIIDWVTLADFERSWDQPQHMRKEWQSSTWAGSIASWLLLCAGIVVIVWLWRARRNVEMLCAARHRLSIGWVIGGWFCPVVNLWFPHMVIADVLRASDPRTPADAPVLRGRPAGPLVTAWWLSFLVGWALTVVTIRLSAPEPRGKTTGEYFVYGVGPAGGWGLIAVELIQTGVLAVAAICLGTIIIQIQRWQEIRASYLDGRPGTGSAPTPRTPSSPTPWTRPAGTAAASASTAATEEPRPTPDPVPPAESSTSFTEPSVQPGPHTLPMRDTDPSTIGPYTLFGRLGSDSVGDIYLGRAADATEVVIRAMHPHHAADRMELARAFAAARTVHSDFTPVVSAADADAPRPWIATEYVAGPSLRDLIAERGPLPPLAVEGIAAGVAHALSALHDAGLVHGALTPSSVIITEAGLRVVDFGVPTQPEPSVFTAPEQLAAVPTGPASDMFSLGGVLAFALTGRAPFGDADAATLLHRIATLRPDLTGIPETRLRFVITGCLAEQPAARLTTAQVLAHLEPVAPPHPAPSARTPVPAPPPGALTSSAAAPTMSPRDEDPSASGATVSPPLAQQIPTRSANVVERPGHDKLDAGAIVVIVLALVIVVAVIVAAILTSLGSSRSDAPAGRARPGTPTTIALPAQLQSVDNMAVDGAGDMWFFDSRSFSQGVGSGVWKRSAATGAAATVPGIGPSGLLSLTATDAGDLYVGASSNELFLGPQPSTFDGILKVSAASATPIPVPTGHDVYPRSIAVSNTGDIYIAGGGRSLKKLPAGSNSVIVQPFPGPEEISEVAVNNVGDIVVVDKKNWNANTTWKLAAGTSVPVRIDAVPGKVADIAISDSGDLYVVPESSVKPQILRFPSGSGAPEALSTPLSPEAVEVTRSGDVYVLGASGATTSVLRMPGQSAPVSSKKNARSTTSTTSTPSAPRIETPPANINQTVSAPERGVAYEVPADWTVESTSVIGGVESSRGRLTGKGYAHFKRATCETSGGPASWISRSKDISDPAAAAVDFGRSGAQGGWDDTKDARPGPAVPLTTAGGGIAGWMVETTGTTRPLEPCGGSRYSVYTFGFTSGNETLVAVIVSDRGVPGAIDIESAKKIFTTLRRL